MAADDFLLIKKIIEKDTGALEQLYEKYKNDVFRYALMITKDQTLADDILQDVFLKIFNNASKCQTNKNVKSWIIQIARNTALDAIRHNSYAESIGDDVYDIKSDKNDFADVEFMEMLRGLNANEQEIVVLHIAYGLKHREIAQILNKTPAAVRQQYKRTIQSLRTNMIDEGGCLNEQKC